MFCSPTDLSKIPEKIFHIHDPNCSSEIHVVYVYYTATEQKAYAFSVLSFLSMYLFRLIFLSFFTPVFSLYSDL